MTVATGKETGAGRSLVLYDGECPLCQKSVALLKRLDWLRRLAFADSRGELPESWVPLDRQRLLEEMHVLTPDRRRVFYGFGAFRWIAWQVPLTWPLLPLLYLPGVPALGQRLYLWVAKNRYGLVPCSHGACSIPLKKK
jgi:predicted DCC family thiol-disulfide oxidoreductase YuxK